MRTLLRFLAGMILNVIIGGIFVGVFALIYWAIFRDWPTGPELYILSICSASFMAATDRD